MSTEIADVGLIGLAVMGENLALNMESRGFRVAVFNRTTARVDEFIQGRAKGKRFVGAHDVTEFVAAIQRPRKIVMLVKAGAPVDQLIDQLLPLLDQGDILIDGGNSLFTDTIRRTQRVEEAGMLFVGSGVSGGEDGALHGPSLMPGGSPAAWPHIKPIFQAVCARTPEGEPCCDWMGENGAGHFVKMIHNGIEYGDMQLIGETYDVMKRVLGMSNAEMHGVFAEWNRAELDSYLIEITRDILGFVDKNGEATIDQILDAAGQKGTGKWTVIEALDHGIPLTLIGEAVFARALSAAKQERVQASKQLEPVVSEFKGDRKQLIEDLRQALYASKIISYAQGYQLLRSAAKQYQWSLNYGGIALVWRGGCIIRSAFLGDIKKAFDRDPQLVNLLLDPFFRDAVSSRQAGWRRAIVAAIQSGIPVPCMSAALSYFDGYRAERLPANLLQAQRDFFGAHTYERVDQPRGEFFHTDWTGHGGATTSRSYSA
ncbi:decarboxylating NADP(+)-dependent phosphogluconate dehydrogenase [Steroidobacter sp. S1-65]|uniref:6-phosphogluconate dehydrogenase, decarboxylating n=1 Tax=Steroidobacter gossypii TaxID=2805490 RepID=A0ABS1X3V8_9GAMM|nr:decarboxylating NADP(+)-dependent phosphogluconate dehydrogenase [Steroidobacter gossypii]MBM0107906.1 decarboxylating NADP(+)-dependent phosphogluconate dehydrogenase [Steroidobacter gossypii]